MACKVDYLTTQGILQNTVCLFNPLCCYQAHHLQKGLYSVGFFSSILQ